MDLETKTLFIHKIKGKKSLGAVTVYAKPKFVGTITVPTNFRLDDSSKDEVVKAIEIYVDKLRNNKFYISELDSRGKKAYIGTIIIGASGIATVSFSDSDKKDIRIALVPLNSAEKIDIVRKHLYWHDADVDKVIDFLRGECSDDQN